METYDGPVTVIRPPSRMRHLDIREYIRYRHLLWSMVYKSIRLEFDQMYLGFLWAVARPLIMMMVFVLFRNLSEAQTYESVPYPLYIFSGMILWFYFVESTNAAAASVKKDVGIITKVYYPRFMSPMVPILSNLYSLALCFIPIAVIMWYLGVFPGVNLALLPLVMLQVMVMIFGLGTLFAALTLTNKDWRKFLMFSLYVGLFVSPVIYAPDMIPTKAQPIFFINPMAGSLLAFRSCLFEGIPFPWERWVYSLAISVVTLVVGAVKYARAEYYFVDEL